MTDQPLVRALAEAAGLALPRACLDGVAENLALLREHWARVARDETEEPA